MPIKLILTFFCLFYSPAVAWTQTRLADQPKITITTIEEAVPAEDAYIIKYYVGEAALNSAYETGSLHIVYSDKTEVIERVPPRKKSAPDDVVFNQVGITDPKLAPDKRTIAWTEQFENSGTSYSIPLVLAIYRSGKNIVHVNQGQMIWNWIFVEGGKRVAAVWGPVHLSDIGTYQLYDVDTGQMIGEAIGNKEIAGKDGTIHGLGPDAPAWAKELEKQQNGD